MGGCVHVTMDVDGEAFAFDAVVLTVIIARVPTGSHWYLQASIPKLRNFHVVVEQLHLIIALDPTVQKKSIPSIDLGEAGSY